MPDRANPFVAGGAVPPRSAFYVERAADRELLDACRGGTLAYLLGSRQSGKSSLLARTLQILIDEGFRCAFVDLTTIASSARAELFRGVLDRMAYDLDVGMSDRKLSSLAALPDQEVLREFFDSIVIPRIRSKATVFIDEFDIGLETGFATSLFASVSALYLGRKANPKLKQAGFVLSGAALPESLSLGAQSGVFDIGVSIDPQDFTAEEIKSAAAYFPCSPEAAQDVLRRILYWTGGHPYLTMRICYLLLRGHSSAHCSPDAVDDIVETALLSCATSDSNLQFVGGMLTARGSDVLDAYRKVWNGGKVIYEANPVKDWLRLSGVVRIVNGLLEVRNLIYRTVFDEDWIDRQPGGRPSIFRRLLE